jgi:hypothetical protein
MRFLKEEVVWAESLTPDLFHDIVSHTCPRFLDERSLPIYNRMRGFVAREGWLAALECLVEVRLPHWRIQAITCEDGRWTCTICLRWFPASWQATVCRAEHAVFELAVLAACLEAVEHASDSRQASATCGRSGPPGRNPSRSHRGPQSERLAGSPEGVLDGASDTVCE